jgi:hypothetical protein
MDFYSSGEPLFLDSQAAASKDTTINSWCKFPHFYARSMWFV